MNIVTHVEKGAHPIPKKADKELKLLSCIFLYFAFDVLLF